MLLNKAAVQPGGVSPTRIWNILVLCTGNSARSIMAEAVFNQFGGGWFHAFSAGSNPTGRVHPLALRQIAACGLYVAHYRSKSAQEFAVAGAPKVDLVLTVCDSARDDCCALLAGESERAHWGLPDPAAVSGEAAHGAFAECFSTLRARVESLRSLPLAEYDTATLARAMEELSTSVPAAREAVHE